LARFYEGGTIGGFYFWTGLRTSDYCARTPGGRPRGLRSDVRLDIRPDITATAAPLSLGVSLQRGPYLRGRWVEIKIIVNLPPTLDYLPESSAHKFLDIRLDEAKAEGNGCE